MPPKNKSIHSCIFLDTWTKEKKIERENINENGPQVRESRLSLRLHLFRESHKSWAARYAWISVCKWGPNEFLGILSILRARSEKIILFVWHMPIQLPISALNRYKSTCFASTIVQIFRYTAGSCLWLLLAARIQYSSARLLVQKYLFYSYKVQNQISRYTAGSCWSVLPLYFLDLLPLYFLDLLPLEYLYFN